MTTPPTPPPADGAYPVATPLLPADPPKIGDFWLDARLTASPSGVAYVGHDQTGTTVMLLLLSAGAAADAAARDRLAGQVNKMHIDTVVARGGEDQDQGRLAGKFRAEDDDPVEPGHEPLAPWVALAYDGSPAAASEAQRLLSEVDLSRLPPKGTPAGPDFALHWIDDTRLGTWRLWPLPWPGRYDRSGRISIVASWLLMILIAMIAILLAILLFSQSGSGGSPPPLPPTASPSDGSGSPPPESGSPSPESGSPSSDSGSPSPASGSPSESSGSPSPGSASASEGAGPPTTNTKL